MKKNIFRNILIPKIAQTLDREILKFEKRKYSNFRSPNIFGSINSKDINNSDFDYINLHWINGGLISLKTISKISKPIVWHVLDLWPISGAEHYFDQDSEFRMVSGYSPHTRNPNDRGLDFNRFTWNQKIKIHKKISAYIAISHWVKEMMVKNQYIDSNKIHVITPPIDQNIFYPENKKLAKKNLGIDSEDFTIGYIGATSPRKGWNIVKKLIDNPINFEKPATWIFFGGDYSQIEYISNNQKISKLGQIRDDAKLRQIYSAMDLLLFPSTTEALGLSVQEAISCGTPVISTAGTGTTSVISDEKNGKLIKGSESEIRKLLKMLSKSPEVLSKWSSFGPKFSRNNWSYTEAVKAYLSIFQNIDNSRKA